MKKYLCLLLVTLMLCLPALAEGVGLTSFIAVDMEGNEVTQEIFAGYDLTAVNIWATWCGYCVEEMPSFSKLVEMLPENVNFITICMDASAEPELAKRILDSANASFTTLIDNAETYGAFTSLISAFPTTCFFNRAGEMVGEPIVGVPSLEDPAGAYYERIMNEAKALGFAQEGA